MTFRTIFVHNMFSAKRRAADKDLPVQRANDLAKEQKLNFGDDIAIQLRIARKKRWNIQEEKRIQQEIELQTYLNRLILEDRDRKIDDLRKTGEDVDLQVGFFSNFSCIFLNPNKFFQI